MTLLDIKNSVNTAPNFMNHARLRLCFPAQAEQVSRVRREVTAYVRRQGWSEDEAEEIVLAVGEACNNAVSYGSLHDGNNCIHLTAHQSRSGPLCIEIRNPGGNFSLDLERLRRLPDSAAIHGRGFALMDALMDEVRVFSTGDETVVRLVKRRTA